MFCNQCGDPIEDGQAYVDRIEDPADKDAPLTLVWSCPTCAEPGVVGEPWRERPRSGDAPQRPTRIQSPRP